MSKIIKHIGVKNYKVEKTFNYDEAKLAQLIKLAESQGIKNIRELLPSSKFTKVEFEITNTFSSFANAIRRALIAELPVYAMDCEDIDIDTDDEFRIKEMIIKNINLIPINQDNEYDDSINIELSVINKTNDVIDVKASDMKINVMKTKEGKTDMSEESETSDKLGSGDKSKKENKQSEMKLSELIPNNNITITQLRQGKYIKIKNIKIVRGKHSDNAAKFGLLNQIEYMPLDVKPYDMYKKTGQRSIEIDGKEFGIKFMTAANINHNTVFKLLCDTLGERLDRMKTLVENYVSYIKKNGDSLYYFDDKLEVKVNDGLYIYKFKGEYITLPLMIAQACYNIDNNVDYCASTIERYDTAADVIKIKHAEPNVLLLTGINYCIDNIEVLRGELYNKIK